MSGIDGGSAFPVVETTVHMTGDGESGYVPISDVHSAGGMTLRDYFAAKAMQGICAHNDTWGLVVDEIVGQSYAIADVMLAARATGDDE